MHLALKEGKEGSGMSDGRWMSICPSRGRVMYRNLKN